MASALIHLAVANEVNKKLKRNENEFLIGSIAPDIAKIIGISRDITHFSIENSDIPDIDLFLQKYQKYLDDDFVLGYYVHLYTDYIWFKYFIPEFYDHDLIHTINGEDKHATEEEILEYIYNDYTNINIDVIDEYNLNLEIFYEEPCEIKNIIKEFPNEHIKKLLDKMSLIIINSKKSNTILFDMDYVNKFISLCVDKILEILDNN